MASNEVKTLVKNRKKIKNKTYMSFFSNDIQNSAQVVSYEYQTYISCGAFDGFPGHDVAEAQLRVSLNSDQPKNPAHLSGIMALFLGLFGYST
jgi:hypothetical protein